MWCLETCACLFHSTPSHLTTPFSLYIPLQSRNWELQRRERRKRKLTIPCLPHPHPQCNQQVGKLAETTQRETCDQQTGLSLEKRKKSKRSEGEVGDGEKGGGERKVET